MNQIAYNMILALTLSFWSDATLKNPINWAETYTQTNIEVQAYRPLKEKELKKIDYIYRETYTLFFEHLKLTDVCLLDVVKIRVISRSMMNDARYFDLGLNLAARYFPDYRIIYVSDKALTTDQEDLVHELGHYFYDVCGDIHGENKNIYRLEEAYLDRTKN